MDTVIVGARGSRDLGGDGAGGVADAILDQIREPAGR
jgi:nucleotide-binding universal stress UspA family protein